MRFQTALSLSLGLIGIKASSCKPTHIAITTSTTDAFSFASGDPTTSKTWPTSNSVAHDETTQTSALMTSLGSDSIETVSSALDYSIPSISNRTTDSEIFSTSHAPFSTLSTLEMLSTSTLPTTSEAGLTSSDSTTLSVNSMTTYPTTALTSGSATLSVTTSATPDTTSSSPATTSSAEPFNFKVFGQWQFLESTEIRAHSTDPYKWTIGTPLFQKPTVLTMEADTGYLLNEGARLCVVFEAGGWFVPVQNCPEIMRSQYEYLVCDPVQAVGDALRCGVPELACVNGGVGVGLTCARTGVQWTQFYARSWYISHWIVGMVSLTSSATRSYFMDLVVRDEAA